LPKIKLIMSYKSIHLSNGYVLHNRYTIREVLGKGGFGITYLAEMLDPNAFEENEFGHRIQLMKYKKVAIKEYFRDNFCQRDTISNKVIITDSDKKRDFDRMVEKHIKEAKTLHAITHPNIVKIVDTFKANNSAYSVMEYLDGMNLQQYIEANGKLAPKIALKYIKDICNAIEYIHTMKILHLDIKPNNLIMTNFNRIVLIDFGASLIYQKSGEIKDADSTSEIVSGISKYYTCAEQNSYDSLKKWNPQFDTYSLVATFYFMITGEVPPLTSDSDHATRLKVSDKSLTLSDFHDSIFRKGLNQAFGERFRDIQELISALNNESFSYNKQVNQKTEETKLIDDFKRNIHTNNEHLKNTQNINNNNVSIEVLQKIETLLNSSKYREAETLINTSKKQYGSKNKDLLYLENRLLKEKPTFNLSFSLKIIIVVLIVSLFFYFLNISDSNNSSENTEQIQTISTEDFLRKHIDSKVLTQFNLEKFEHREAELVEDVYYKHNSQFDYIHYSGQVNNAIPNGIGKAFNQGINPKTNLAYNSSIQGLFENGLLNGYGKLEQSDGTVYEGYFKNGLPHGEGNYYENANAKPIQVICDNGKCTPK
jgi:serine/threonine protein kinase